jgi:hypothetical protein
MNYDILALQECICMCKYIRNNMIVVDKRTAIQIKVCEVPTFESRGQRTYTRAYVSIRQRIREHTSAYVSVYASIRQHTSDVC